MRAWLGPTLRNIGRTAERTRIKRTAATIATITVGLSMVSIPFLSLRRARPRQPRRLFEELAPGLNRRDPVINGQNDDFLARVNRLTVGGARAVASSNAVP